MTADEVPDPQALRLRTRVNGEVVQDASTAGMLFPVAVLVSCGNGRGRWGVDRQRLGLQ